MKRAFIVATDFAATVAACGGGAEDAAPDPARFCELGADNNAFGGQAIFSLSGDQAAAEARANLDELAEVAPAEIRSSVDTLISYAHEFIDLIEAADFNAAAIDLAASHAIGTEAEESDEVVNDWIATNCAA